ncbi:MAG TPA: hypothetical protein PKN27_10155, partial [Propionibacteriaceae bacterium]|nr:hypothetical protein [Propionibacteriaceae bacterium]
MVTIGSPLANSSFQVERLRETLSDPPTNLAWWVNFWNPADPVAMHQGLSSIFPWMVDHRIRTIVRPDVHDAGTYLANQAVAATVGFALFGSQSKELAVIDKSIDIPLDFAETVALMALRYGYLITTKLNGERKERFANALRQVQADVVDRIKERNHRASRLLPASIAGLAVDLSDPQSAAPEPSRVNHLTKEDAV